MCFWLPFYLKSFFRAFYWSELSEDSYTTLNTTSLNVLYRKHILKMHIMRYMEEDFVVGLFFWYFMKTNRHSISICWCAFFQSRIRCSSGKFNICKWRTNKLFRFTTLSAPPPWRTLAERAREIRQTHCYGGSMERWKRNWFQSHRDLGTKKTLPPC